MGQPYTAGLVRWVGRLADRTDEFANTIGCGRRSEHARPGHPSASLPSGRIFGFRGRAIIVIPAISEPDQFDSWPRRPARNAARGTGIYARQWTRRCVDQEEKKPCAKLSTNLFTAPAY